MTTDSKSQPTGWVVVSFKYASEAFYDDNAEYHGGGGSIFSSIQPFKTAEDAEIYCSGAEEVHPWPLPASVLARLKERHPTVDWSQVPVADAPVEKPGRWVVQELPDEPDLPFRDQDGWQQSADVCLMPWSTKADVEAFMRSKGWISDCFVPVNLDDLPAPAVAEPSEVDRLRAEVERLTRERDELREELSRCKQAHSAAEDDVESLREQLGKATLSRRDEFAKAAIMGLCAHADFMDMSHRTVGEIVVGSADATIRALDGAGGA